MNLQAAWGYSPPDDPLRRLFWVVPLALLLVLLFVVGVSQWLRHQAPVKTQPPIDARIYELPPSRSMLVSPRSGKTMMRSPVHAERPPLESKLERQPQNVHPQESLPKVSPPVSPPLESAGRPLPRASAPAKPRPVFPTRSAQVVKPARPLINWSKFNQQINAAVAATVNRSELPQIHDPHTLIARYYLATVLRKLQRVGDMNYPGNLVGITRIMVVIGRHGELIGYKLLDSSGNPALDRVSDNIVHMSAPFAPFPAKMGKETTRVKLTITMRFEGYRDLNPE